MSEKHDDIKKYLDAYDEFVLWIIANKIDGKNLSFSKKSINGFFDEYFKEMRKYSNDTIFMEMYRKDMIDRAFYFCISIQRRK